MAKQKKSFLDKIINGDKNEEQEKEQSEVNQEESANREGAVNEETFEENKNKRENSDMDLIANDDVGQESKESAENIKSNEDNKKEEWFEGKDENKEEGQLTIDVYQMKDCIVIKSIVGGVGVDDLDISVTGDMVTIKGKRVNVDEVKSDDYYYQECFWGNFSRSVILPCDIKTDEVEATMKNGILTVKLPKIEKSSSIKVKVQER